MEQIRNIQEEADYYVTDVENEEFKVRSTLVAEWADKAKCVVVIDQATKRKMILTPFDYHTGISDNIFKRSYHEGRFANLTFKFIEEKLLHDTEKTKWLEALLQRWHWGWLNLIKSYLITDEFRNLNRELNVIARQTKTIWPLKEDVYRMFSFRPDMLRVVILGQDPYPSSHANGIGFATNQIVTPVSLKTIEKAIIKELNYDEDWEISNDLLNVVKQGVYLFNSALTVEAHKPNSYSEQWKPFMNKMVATMSNLPQPIIFVLMGRNAHGFESEINSEKHIVYKIPHPASAGYNNEEWNTDNVFYKINEHLKQLGTPRIKW